MDSEHFDQLTKALATGTSRRRLLGGLLGTALTGLGVRNAAAQTACPRETPTRCGDTCADLRADPTNCGRCGRACGNGEVCYAGRCLTTCPSGFEACGGTCHRSCGAGQVRLDDCTCCTLTKTSCAPGECGEFTDGCGGVLDCEGCPPGADQICVETTCVDRCQVTLQAGGCSFDELDQRWVCPSDANLENANLAGCDLTNAALSGVFMRFATLTNATLTNATLTNTTLSGANLTNAILTNANLTNAILTNANLNGANLLGAFLDGANLNGATMTNADMFSVWMRQADLTNGNLDGSTLQCADLRNAILVNADLTNVNLLGSNLNSADLTFAFWGGNTTCPNRVISGNVGNTCSGQLQPDVSSC